MNKEGVRLVDVMVVEDDEAILSFVKSTLEEAGYSVGIAINGREALNKMRNSEPRMMILDLMLPEMDGWTLARHMREDTKLKDVPIVVMSAHRNARKEAESLGAVGCLPKPFDLDDLFSFVEGQVGTR